MQKYVLEFKMATDILQLDKDCIEGKLLAGNALYENGETEKALQYYKKVLEQDATNHIAIQRREMCEIMLCVGSYHTANVPNTIEQAEALAKLLSLCEVDDWDSVTEYIVSENMELVLGIAEEGKAQYIISDDIVFIWQDGTRTSVYVGDAGQDSNSANMNISGIGTVIVRTNPVERGFGRRMCLCGSQFLLRRRYTYRV